MVFTNDQIKQIYLNKRFIACASFSPHIIKDNVYLVDDITYFECAFYTDDFNIQAKKVLNETTGARVNLGFKELLYSSVPLNATLLDRTIEESTFNKINTSSKFDKYKGKLVLEIKNNSIIISNNLLNILQVSTGDRLAFYTSVDNKLFIAKSLEDEGILLNKNKITENDAKNIIEIFRNKFDDKNMYSIQLTITKDLDNPDYCFYEIIPIIDKTIVIPTKKKNTELFTDLLNF